MNNKTPQPSAGGKPRFALDDPGRALIAWRIRTVVRYATAEKGGL